MIFDFGSILVILFFIVYLFPIIFFPSCKRNEVFGLRHKKCFESEEIWHKIHVRAAIMTIPFAILNLLLIFMKNAIAKTVLSLIILTLVIVGWNIIVKYTDRDYFKRKALEEEKQLKEQIKKESGWR